MSKTFTGSIATGLIKKQVGRKINGAIGALKDKCQLIKDCLQPDIDIDLLKRLHTAGDVCNSEYTEELDQQLKVPEEVKVAWKNFSDARRQYEEVLLKYDIEL